MAVSAVIGVGTELGCRTLGWCPEIWRVSWLEETTCTFGAGGTVRKNGSPALDVTGFHFSFEPFSLSDPSQGNFTGP